MARVVINRQEAAEPQYRRALALFGKNALDDATALLDKLIETHPKHSESWHLLGVIALKRGQFAEAERLLAEAVALNPKAEVAVNNLGTAYLQQSKLTEAGNCYRKAIALKPTYAVAHNHLGNVLLLEDRLEDALGAYKRAVLLDPPNPEIHNNMGSVYSKLERYAEAEASYRAAIKHRGFYPQAHANLANTLAQQGRFDQALNSYLTAIAMNNHYGEAYQHFAANHKFAPGDRFEKMFLNAEAKLAEFPQPDRIYLQFALGKFYNDLKKPDEAFRHLSEACAAKRRSISFDIEVSEKRFDGIAAAYPAAPHDEWTRHPEAGHPSRVPVFIVGMPRSGTTLIEQILSNHPQVYGAGEVTDLDTARKGRREDWRANLDDAEERAELRERAGRYVNLLRRRAPSARRITDKMPHNARALGIIHMMLPNATIIHCRRNPVDTCLSCFQQHFVEGQAWSYDLAELGRYYVNYARLMDHWRNVLPEGRILDVDYENVVDDLETEARRIITHCGLDWDDACLAFHRNKRAVRTASQQQVREPIYSRSVGRWKPYEKYLSPLLDALSPVLTD